MNRRDALKSLVTLPMAASTIDRTPTLIEGSRIGWTDLTPGGSGKILLGAVDVGTRASAWDQPYGATPNIGHG